MPRLRPRAVLTTRDWPTQAPRELAPPTPGGTGGVPDTTREYLSRLIAYIPAESISVYQAIRGFVPAGDRAVAMPFLELLLIVLTPIWVRMMTREGAEPTAWHQVVISGLAFVVWLTAVGAELLTHLPFPWRDYYGSIAMVACGVLIFPLLERLFRRFA